MPSAASALRLVIMGADLMLGLGRQLQPGETAGADTIDQGFEKAGKSRGESNTPVNISSRQRVYLS